MKKTKTILRNISLLLLAGVTLAGCSRDESAADAREAGAQLNPERSVTVSADDKMKFDVAEITVKRGEVVELTLKNVGTMPKFSMGHNLVILQRDADVNAFCTAAQTAASTDYVPVAMKDEVIAATKLLGGGESDTIVFRAPARAGDYPFVCSFPGHFQVGMKGTLVVE